MQVQDPFILPVRLPGSTELSDARFGAACLLLRPPLAEKERLAQYDDFGGIYVSGGIFLYWVLACKAPVNKDGYCRMAARTD